MKRIFYRIYKNIKILIMKTFLLFTLIATATSTSLRQDAPLFRTEPQEAKVERHMETPNECTICQYLVGVMQNEVIKDGSLFQQSKLEEFKTVARHACHRHFHLSTAQEQCLDIVMNEGYQLMDQLYALSPSTCEVMDHCKRCRPCQAPAQCLICEAPSSKDVTVLRMLTDSWNQLKNYWTTPTTNNEFDETWI